MIQTVNFYDFERAFKLADRSNEFSYGGLEALFKYLEELEYSCGEQIELDVAALCCDYSEMELSEALEQYRCESMEELCHEIGCVIEVDEDTVIVCG